MHRRSWKSSSSPRIAGVQWSSTVRNILWGMVPDVAVVLDIVLGLAEIAPAFWWLQRAAWSLLWGYRPPGVRLAAFRGSYRLGSSPGQGRSRFRGSCPCRSRAPRKGKYEGGMGSWQYNSWSSAEHVLHCVAGSHSGIRNGGAVTGVGGRDSGHSYCGK
jgi:hypothetical protein